MKRNQSMWDFLIREYEGKASSGKYKICDDFFCLFIELAKEICAVLYSALWIVFKAH